jgi:3-oxoacyl-ACP reductase-like protein
MNQSNTIAKEAEMHGIQTFSTKEMAFNIICQTTGHFKKHL